MAEPITHRKKHEMRTLERFKVNQWIKRLEVAPDKGPGRPDQPALDERGDRAEPQDPAAGEGRERANGTVPWVW